MEIFPKTKTKSPVVVNHGDMPVQGVLADGSRPMSHNRNRMERRRDRNAGVRRHRIAAVAPGGERCHPVMSIIHVAERLLKTGVVVRCDVPFADRSGSKIRPAVVVGRRGGMVEVMPITTSKNVRFPVDVPVHELEPTGLRRPSVVRTNRVIAIERHGVIGILGALGERDRISILGMHLA
jgi:hypothetical protein